jgi:copper chaperone CopZ
VRVALEKVDGVQSVSVTLKRGVAHLVLKKANTVRLTDLRRIVKEAGYTSREATVTVVGTVRTVGAQLTLAVEGTTELLELGVDAGRSLADVERGVDHLVEVTGSIRTPDPQKSGERIQVQTISVVR